MASPCEDCFGLSRGSWILDPCGHVLCAACNDKYKEKTVCPTCRSKMTFCSEWTDEGANKVIDIDNASFVMPETESADYFDTK